MIDFGSAEPGFWSNDQLLQMTDGFRPNLAVPEIYFNCDSANHWTDGHPLAFEHQLVGPGSPMTQRVLRGNEAAMRAKYVGSRPDSVRALSSSTRVSTKRTPSRSSKT